MDQTVPNPFDRRTARRKFLKDVVTGAAASAAVLVASPARAQPAGVIRRFDHVAVPIQNVDAMVAFYRALGMQVVEGAQVCTAHFGDNMINFHRPTMWQRETFTLRAPAAKPPCGDFCFVFDGTADQLKAMIERLKLAVVEGPVKRPGGRDHGQGTGTATSTYVRDPDGNLLEFMIYP